MNLKKILGTAFGILFLTGAALFAQEQTNTSTDQQTSESSSSSAPADTGPKFTAGFQFGTMTLDGTNYNAVRLMPDFSIGNFGVGLDINFEWSANGDFRTSEWNTWQAVLSKILYIRYGQKHQPAYVKIGSNNDFTFGNGFLMNRYSNMLNYPALKKLGLAFDLDFNTAGFESMVDNIFAWNILGIRAFYRPLIGTDIPVFNKFEIGATVAADTDPKSPLPSADKPYNYQHSANPQPVTGYGADLGLPLVSIPSVFDMRSYVDFAGIANKGTGEMAGIGGSIISLIPYKIEARLFQPKFIPSYFDSFYDASRPYKYDSLDLITDGYFGWLLGSGLNLFDGNFAWGLAMEGSFQTNAKPSLTMSIDLKKDLIKLGEMHLSWIRKNINTFSDAFSADGNGNSIFLLSLDYFASQNLVLSVDYKRTFKTDPVTGMIQPYTSTTFNTRVTF